MKICYDATKLVFSVDVQRNCQQKKMYTEMQNKTFNTNHAPAVLTNAGDCK